MPSPVSTAVPQRSPKLHLVAGVLLIGVFWMLTKWLAGQSGFESDPGESERAAVREKTLLAIRAEEKSKLETFAWVDRSSGSVQIPIALAMKLVLPELRASKPRPAYPIASPQPTPAVNSPGSAGILPALSGILPDSCLTIDLASKDAGECGQDARAPGEVNGYRHLTP